MVSEPLLWPFLSSLVFIGVTPFSTSLLPSQQLSQPLAVEPLMSSSHHPWVLDLQPSLRSFTLQRPLPFASPLQILLRLHFWRYHWDRLTLIYTLEEASKPSETACSPVPLKGSVPQLTCLNAPLHIWVVSPCTPMHCIFKSHAFTHLPTPQPSCWRHFATSALVVSSLTSLACVNRLTSSFDFWRFDCWLLVGLIIDFQKVDRWLFPRVDFLQSSAP